MLQLMFKRCSFQCHVIQARLYRITAHYFFSKQNYKFSLTDKKRITSFIRSFISSNYFIPISDPADPGPIPEILGTRPEYTLDGTPECTHAFKHSFTPTGIQSTYQHVSGSWELRLDVKYECGTEMREQVRG